MSRSREAGFEIWVDAQLPPSLAPWIELECGIRAFSVRRLGLRDATDAEIFEAARKADAIVLTKDSDFVQIVSTLGPPPRIVWLTIGNTSNARVRKVLLTALPAALSQLAPGFEDLIEISE